MLGDLHQTGIGEEVVDATPFCALSGGLFPFMV